MREQYRQIRRWAYGVIDFPYIMEQNAISQRIPLGLRIAQTYRQISQFHLWAVVPLLLMTLRPIATAIEPTRCTRRGCSPTWPPWASCGPACSARSASAFGLRGAEAAAGKAQSPTAAVWVRMWRNGSPCLVAPTSSALRRSTRSCG